MKVSIDKSTLEGTVTAPSSKSYTIRGLICAALADGQSEISDPLGSDDTAASHDVLTATGIKIEQQEKLWKVRGGKFNQPTGALYCRESAATLRFMTAISSVIPGECRLTMAESLAARPIGTLVDALRQLGVEIAYTKGENRLTVSSGTLPGGVTQLPGNISSQYVSALLFISPLSQNGVNIRLTTPLESRSFLQMTLETLKSFGIRVATSDTWREYRIPPQRYLSCKYQVEADWSSASYLLALGALTGQVEVMNLKENSLQGDRVVLDMLRQMGASVSTGQKSVTVEKSRLKAIKANLNECIDMLPTMAVLAASAEGTSVLTGIKRARIKESDRVTAVREGLTALGIKVVEEEDSLSITGSHSAGGMVKTRGDHRIAMAFGVLGCLTGNVTLDNAECVSKTYPDFWEDLGKLGGKVKIYE